MVPDILDDRLWILRGGEMAALFVNPKLAKVVVVASPVGRARPHIVLEERECGGRRDLRHALPCRRPLLVGRFRVEASRRDE